MIYLFLKIIKNVFSFLFPTRIKYTTTNFSTNKLSKNHESDACYDLQSDEFATIEPGCRLLVKTGTFLELPKNWEAQVRSRSGLALKYGISVLNSPGTIDSNYRGPVNVILHNSSQDQFEIKPGDRIAQIAFQKVPRTKILWVSKIDVNTDRGEKGFGSSGK